MRAVFGARVATPAEVVDLRFGRPVDAVGRTGAYGMFAPDDGALLALVEETGGRARPVLVWQAAG